MLEHHAASTSQPHWWTWLDRRARPDRAAQSVRQSQWHPRMTVVDDVQQEANAPTPAGHPRILALANQKGGVGKTTTAINLGTALAAIGERVLIVDLDPQGNASTGLGLERKSRRVSTYHVLAGAAALQDAITETAVPRLSIAPSTLDL